MIHTRAIGIVWVIAGFVLLLLANRREPRDLPLLLFGIGFVALGAAMIRRSSRRGGGR